MLHILLLILKITGIIIAAILGILVLLICVVLFVAGRYEIAASCDGRLSEIRATAKLTWFVNLVRLYVCYEKSKMTWSFRIAWKNRQSGQEDKKNVEEEVETYGEKISQKCDEEAEQCSERNSDDAGACEAVEETETGACQDMEAAKTDTGEDVEETETRADQDMEETETGADQNVEETETDACEAVEETETDACQDVEETETGACQGVEETEASTDEGMEEGKQIWKRIVGIWQKIVRNITALYRKITGIPGKIEDMLRGISGRLGKLSQKKKKIVDFVSDDVHKTAFLKVRDESLYLLGKLKPRKIRAKIHYGFEDPYLTGKVLAGISMIYPFLGRDVHVDPDFEKQIFEGDLKITGRIRVSYFVRLLWKLIWCKEVRVTYRHVREFEL
ncbi:hypothetical protein C817_02527 [Dorea sp. 5-2]|nr:hypothetical protein C817_02527 [Dorea sp. 5-2]